MCVCVCVCVEGWRVCVCVCVCVYVEGWRVGARGHWLWEDSVREIATCKEYQS